MMVVEPIILLVFILCPERIRQRIVTNPVGKIIMYLFFGLWAFSIIFWTVTAVVKVFDPYFRFNFDSFLYLLNLIAFAVACVNGGLYTNNQMT